MGKSRNKRRNKSSSNFNPIGIPSVKEAEKLVAEFQISPNTSRATKQSVLQNLLEEVQSGDDDKRLRALLGMGCLSDVELDRNSLRIITPMLMDPSCSVQLAAANALRMFVLSGGGQVADTMIKNDIMTIVSAQLIKLSENLFGAKNVNENLSLKEAYISLVKLLWALCENSELVIKLVNNAELLTILISACQHDDKSISIPSAQCLQTISEDNPQAVSYVSKSQSNLINILNTESNDPDFLHLQCLIAGIVVNMHHGLVSRVLPATTGIIVNVLSRCLSQDIKDIIDKFVPEPMDQRDDPEEDDEDEDNKTDKKLKSPQIAKLTQKVLHIIDAQICSLEILANICSNDDDDEDEMDTSEGSEDNLSESETWGEDMTEASQALTLPPCLSVEVHEALLCYGLLSKTMNMTYSVPSDVFTSLGDLAEEEGIAAKLQKRQCRALLSLHNLLRGLNIEELGGPEQMAEAWKTLATKIATEWRKDTELLDAGTTSLRALTLKLAEEKCGSLLIKQINPQDLEIFCGLVDTCNEANVKINIYRIVAAISAIASDNYTDTTNTLITIAGKFLLEESCKDNELWVVAEALDSLMDALAEDCSDQICAELQLVSKLRALLPSLQRKIRAGRRNGPSAIVTTVKTNLTRFIKYKAQRLS